MGSRLCLCGLGDVENCRSCRLAGPGLYYEGMTTNKHLRDLVLFSSPPSDVNLAELD